MFDNIPFTEVPGPKSEPSVFLFALSTCGFCRRGQEFLEKNGFSYRFVHLDKVDPSLKASAKEEFKTLFAVGLSYPSLVVDGKHTVGYIKRFWEDLLGLAHEDEAQEVEALDEDL